MTTPHQAEVVLTEDGKLILNQLPYQAGQKVQVTVTPLPTSEQKPHPLHGTVLRYDRPTEPVAEDDWEVLR